VTERTFGDWHKGKIEEAETFNVSYSYVDPDTGASDKKTVKVLTKMGKKGAGQRVVRQLKRSMPNARITVRMIWKPGMSPGGIYLPDGIDWIDDEVKGKGSKSQ
jgi:hypothetical protein